MDLLDCMLVTAEVFHFERSELNAEAPSNAVRSRGKEKGNQKKKEGIRNIIIFGKNSFIQVIVLQKDTYSVLV